MARVLVPIPERDFDPTEVAVPWRALTARTLAETLGELEKTPD